VEKNTNRANTDQDRIDSKALSIAMDTKRHVIMIKE
jgi:hypothetical protein